MVALLFCQIALCGQFQEATTEPAQLAGSVNLPTVDEKAEIVLNMHFRNREFSDESSYGQGHLLASPGQYIQACSFSEAVSHLSPVNTQDNGLTTYIVTGDSPVLNFDYTSECPDSGLPLHRYKSLQSPEPFFVLTQGKEKEESSFPFPNSQASDKNSLPSNSVSLSDDDGFDDWKPGRFPYDMGQGSDFVIDVVPVADLQLYAQQLWQATASFHKLLPASVMSSWFSAGQENSQQPSVDMPSDDMSRLRMSVRVNGGRPVYITFSRYEWQGLREELLKKGFSVLPRWINFKLSGRGGFVQQLLDHIERLSRPEFGVDPELLSNMVAQLDVLLELPDTDFDLNFEVRQLVDSLASSIDVSAHDYYRQAQGGTQKGGGKQKSNSDQSSTESDAGSSLMDSSEAGTKSTGGKKAGDGKKERGSDENSQKTGISNSTGVKGRVVKNEIKFETEDFVKNDYICGAGQDSGSTQRGCGLLMTTDCFQLEDGSRICEGCNGLLKSPSNFRDRALERERNNIMENWNFICLDCAQRQNSAEQFKHNKLQQHAEGHWFRCDRCRSAIKSDVFLSSAEKGQKLTRHQRTCKPPCFYCKDAQYKDSLEIHYFSCKSQPVKCGDCADELMSINGWLAHASKKHKYTTCVVSDCNMVVTATEIADHINAHVQESDTSWAVRQNAKTLLTYHDQNQPYLVMLSVKEKLKESARYDEKIKTLTQQNSDLKTEINSIKMDIGVKLQPVVDAVVKAESAIQHLQEGFSEMALMVQTLQATSYNGVFVWKIPEVQRRRHEAKIGKTLSLYSAPFYTSRHGYKLCLRLYMDGDGSGKNTHLSFFLTVMRGEYDALLTWPFRQAVTLKMLDQDKIKDIVQSFNPEPSSSSFQRPRNEMNIASGCPQFAPLSILINSAYVKDDTFFLKAEIDLRGLNTD